MICSTCAAVSDVADVPMWLRPPERVVQKQQMAALALRVSRAIAAAQWSRCRRWARPALA
jgi:hypothetical protein